MMSRAVRRFDRLSTAAKLLLILTAVLLPIGIGLAWVGVSGAQNATDALRGRSEDQSRAAARAIESLIARNSLALRVAAAAAIRNGNANPCDDAVRALATAPAISHRFTLGDGDGRLLCSSDGFQPRSPLPLVAPGDIRMWIDPNGSEIDIRIGVIGGMATASLSRDEIRSAAVDVAGEIKSLSVTDGKTDLHIIGAAPHPNDGLTWVDWPIGNEALVVRIGSSEARITAVDRLILLLPVLMWVLAALVASDPSAQAAPTRRDQLQSGRRTPTPPQARSVG